MLDDDGIRAGLSAAHERLLQGYAEWGGWRFHGWTHEEDAENFDGPRIWSEADCVFRYALELEREFPDAVHCGVKINKSTRADFPADESERAQTVDVAVADLSEFTRGADVHSRFRRLTYDAFIEVKWFRKGWLGQKYEFDGRGRLKEVEFDLLKLDRHLQLGRCRVAAMLIWDDEAFYEIEGSDIAIPSGIEVLWVGPRELERRDLLPSRHAE